LASELGASDPKIAQPLGVEGLHRRQLNVNNTGTSCASAQTFNYLMYAGQVSYEYALLASSTGSFVWNVCLMVAYFFIGLFLNFFGSKLVKTVVTLVTLVVGFMAYLYLFNWAFGSNNFANQTGNNPNDFVTCILPLILSGVCAIVSSLIVLCLFNKVECLAFFIFGAASGYVIALVVQQIILASAPQLTRNQYWQFYYLFALGFAVALGLITSCLRAVIALIATVIIGSYIIASAINAFIQLAGGQAPSYVWFISLGVALIAGFIVQVFVVKGLEKDD